MSEDPLDSLMQRANSLGHIIDTYTVSLTLIEPLILLTNTILMAADNTHQKGNVEKAGSRLTRLMTLMYKLQTTALQFSANMNSTSRNSIIEFKNTVLGRLNDWLVEIISSTQWLANSQCSAEAVALMLQQADYNGISQLYTSLLMAEHIPDEEASKIGTAMAAINAFYKVPEHYMLLRRRREDLPPMISMQLGAADTPMLIETEFVPTSELWMGELRDIGVKRGEFFVLKKRWVIPATEEAVLKHLNMPSQQLQNPFDLDLTDIAPTTVHTTMRIQTEGLEGTNPLTYCRIIPLISSRNQDEQVTTKELLQSMEYSPFDVKGHGPNLDLSAVDQAKLNPARFLKQIGVEDYLTTQTREDAQAKALDLLQAAGFDVHTSTGSTTDQSVKTIHEALESDPSCVKHRIALRFTDRIKSRKPILLLERLFTNASREIQFGALLNMMVECAIFAYRHNMPIWLIQCDENFTTIVKNLFGPDSFLDLATISQVKKQKGEQQEYQTDVCNTMVLDIELALRHLFQNEGTRDIANHVINSVKKETGQDITPKGITVEA